MEKGVLLEIPFLEFKRVFRSQCSGGNCGEGETIAANNGVMRISKTDASQEK